MIGGWSVSGLVSDAPVVARLGAVTLYLWNPWVLERLALGQWGFVLGYAFLPLVVRAAFVLRDDVRRGWAPTVLWLGASAICTPSSGSDGSAHRDGDRADASEGSSRCSSSWGPRSSSTSRGSRPPCSVLRQAVPPGASSLPSVRARSRLRAWCSASSRSAACGRRASCRGSGRGTRRGALGGPDRHRARRTVAGTARGSGDLVRGLGAVAAVSVLLALVPTWGPAQSLVRTRCGRLRRARHPARLAALPRPGGAAARGRAGPRHRRRVAGRGRARQALKAVAVLLLLWPILVLPSLSWGISGYYDPVDYPAEWGQVSKRLESLPSGTTVVLPWLGGYRGFPWNGPARVPGPGAAVLPGRGAHRRPPAVQGPGAQLGGLEAAPGRRGARGRRPGGAAAGDRGDLRPRGEGQRAAPRRRTGRRGAP